MQTSDIRTLTMEVLWAAFLLSVIFGAIAQRTHFCTMGAISDVVNMGDWTRMRQWGMAIGVAMIGFAALVYSGQIDPSKTLYASTRWIWLSAIVGGGLFGFGMVLTSGCASKTLIRIGGGSLKSLMVFGVMGVAAFATLKGITAVARVDTVDKVAINFAAGTALPNLALAAFGIKIAVARLILSVLLGGGLIVWALAGPDFRRADNLLAGIGIGAVIVAMWWVSGHLGYVAEDPNTLQDAFLGTNSGRAEAFSFVAPAAYTLNWLIYFSDASNVLTVGIVSVFGMVLGSAACAIVMGRFRWEGFGSTEDVANHMSGAVFMGVGGVTALGCTIGQGLSGISTLSATSFVAVAAIVSGAVAALKYQAWRMERMA
ncbi:MAG: YeeE/YedE family protein [Rhodoferax sp.]